MLEAASTIGWRTLERRSHAWLVGLYALSLAVYLASLPVPRVDGHLVGSDGVFYYSYLPALLVDGSLDFSRAYAGLLPAETVAQIGWSPTGLLRNDYAVGPALLWAPFFVAGHGLVLLLRALGSTIPADGLGIPYQLATLIGSISYGFAGLWLIHRSCRRFFDRATSTLVIVLLWATTSVLYYIVAEPSMSHTVSLFAVALFVDLWLSSRPCPGVRRWASLGLAGGLVAMVRLPDATFLALPVLDALVGGRLFGRRGLSSRRSHGGRGGGTGRGDKVFVGEDVRDAGGARILLCSAAYAGGLAVAFAPQIVAWQLLYGSPFVSGYLYTDSPTFNWLAPKALEVLFSPLHGLFLWHPLLLLAVVGLGLLYRRDGWLTVLICLGVAMQVYIIGAWRDWGQGDAFGGRMFISSFPVLALGLGASIEWAAARGHLSALATTGVVLTIWNGLLLAQYRLGYIPMNAPITLEQYTIGKVSMLADLARRFILKAGP